MKNSWERLSDYIDNQEISKKEICEKASLSYNNFTLILVGKKPLGINVLKKLKSVLPSMSLNWIMFAEGMPDVSKDNHVNESLLTYEVLKKTNPEDLMLAGLKDFIIKTAKEAVDEELAELQEDILILFKRDLESAEKRFKQLKKRKGSS